MRARQRDTLRFGDNTAGAAGRDLVVIRKLYDDPTGTGSIIFDVQKTTTGTPSTSKQGAATITNYFLDIDAGSETAHTTDLELGIQFDPNSAFTLAEHRSVEVDTAIQSGTLITEYAFDARVHIGIAGGDNGTLTNWIGFHGFGPTQWASLGTLTNVTCFQSDYDSNDAATVGGTWTGFEFKDPSGHTITGAVTGFWSNMDSSDTAIAFGTSKESKIAFETEAPGMLNFTHTRTTAPGENKTFYSFAPTLSGDASTFDITGVGVQATYSGTGNSTGTLIGNLMSFASTGTGTIADVIGAQAGIAQVAIGANTGAVTKATGLKVIDSGVIEAGGTAGAITDLIGIEVVKQTNGSSNYGIWLNGDDVGADIVFGAGKDVQMHFNGTNLELQGTGIAAASITTETLSEYITVAVNGVAKKIAIVA